MHSRLITLFATIVILLGVFAVPGGAHPGEGDPTDERVSELREKFISLTSPASIGDEHGSADDRPARSRNLTQVGSNDFDGQGFNADVWALGKYAYVGRWGLFTGNGELCPATGTEVVDISQPASPEHVDTIPTEANTQTNDVKVAKVSTRQFRGDLLAVSNEDCAPSGARGFELWDVSDPENASELGRWGPVEAFDDSVDLPAWGFGVHNVFIFEQGPRVYVAAVMDFTEIFQLIFNGQVLEGDLRIVDVTDPENPVQVGDWGAVKDLGLDPFGPNGDVFLHDVWVENDIAYLSYWDAGLILLDVSDPTDPQFISRTDYWPEEEGDTHVAVPARGGNLVITGDEDFSPDPWGFMRVFDTQDQTAPVQIARFDTGNLDTPASEGDFSMHNVIVRGNTAYLSWYSDGIQLVDISQPSSPRGIGSFIPEAADDPFGILPSAPEMWGVYVQGNLILGSDMNSGLHILRTTP